MDDRSPTYTLDAAPDAEAIARFREEAQSDSTDVIARYSTAEGEARDLVVSPRGTCVVLADNISRDAFAPQKDAAVVAEALTT
jgi:hypothetical protein